MASKNEFTHVSEELAALQHDKKNQNMKALPSNMSVQRRPLLHDAIASPYAGAHVPKVVLVSRRTPIMSAVKRVKKFLRHVEKRAIQSVEAKDPRKTRIMPDLSTVSEKLAQGSEEVLVKASGRAMEQALRVGEWFRTKETEMACKVEVRTGSVAAIDDIVESKNSESDSDSPSEVDATDLEPHLDETTLEGGDTTLEILGHKSTATQDDSIGGKEPAQSTSATQPKKKSKRRRRKRKREVYEDGDVPEARIRWVKTVEVAISLRA